MAQGIAMAAENQEQVILDAAAKCIESSSLLDFTMSAISKEAGLSMGSIYKYIQCKEDVLLALGCQAQTHFGELASRLMSLPLPFTGRVLAIQLVEERQQYSYSFGMELVILLANHALLHRASSRWREQYITRGIAVEKIFHEALGQAYDAGELRIADDKPEAILDEIISVTWALCTGHRQVTRQREVRHIASDVPTPEPDTFIIHALQRLLNTYDWRVPLSDEIVEQACQYLHEQGLRELTA